MYQDQDRQQGSVLVIGEALIDAVSRDGHTVEHPGGSPANVALGLCRLGVETLLFTNIGNDARGSAIAEHLQKDGVHLDPSSITEAPTSLAAATIDTDGSAHYEFDIHWSFTPPVEAMQPRVIHAGSVASFHSQGLNELIDYVRENSKDSVVTYDPNIRPALVGGHDAALSIFESWCGIANVVKLSDEDAQWLYPDLGLDDVAHRILGLGAVLVAITAGGEGSKLYSRQETVVIPLIKTAVVDTIGAGDSYMSALIYGLLNAHLDSLDAEAIRKLGVFAAQAAAVTVSRAGANPPASAELSSLVASEFG